MYVYILNDGCSFYGGVVGVYSSKEKAEKALKKFNKKLKVTAILITLHIYKNGKLTRMV